jgi:cytochrome c biogenesis protein CcdA
MVGLVAIGFIAGFIAGISPCTLPVLPVVLVAGATTPEAPGEPGRKRRRPLAVVGGVVVSFSLLVLAGSEFLSLFHLPQDLLRDAGIATLVIVGVGFLVPRIGALVERPFGRLRARQPSGKAGGFVLCLAPGRCWRRSPWSVRRIASGSLRSCSPWRSPSEQPFRSFSSHLPATNSCTG